MLCAPRPRDLRPGEKLLALPLCLVAGQEARSVGRCLPVLQPLSQGPLPLPTLPAARPEERTRPWGRQRPSPALQPLLQSPRRSGCPEQRPPFRHHRLPPGARPQAREEPTAVHLEALMQGESHLDSPHRSLQAMEKLSRRCRQALMWGEARCAPGPWDLWPGENLLALRGSLLTGQETHALSSCRPLPWRLWTRCQAIRAPSGGLHLSPG